MSDRIKEVIRMFFTVEVDDLNDELLNNLFMVYHTKVFRTVAKLDEYREELTKFKNLENTFMEHSTKEQYELLDKITIQLDEIHYCMNRGYFKEGFIQGVRLMQETSSNK